MNTGFSVTLAKIIKETGLNKFYMPSDPQELLVSSMEINRPGLELTGYMEYFDKERIIIFGNTEYSYLEQFDSDKQYEILLRNRDEYGDTERELQARKTLEELKQILKVIKNFLKNIIWNLLQKNPKICSVRLMR